MTQRNLPVVVEDAGLASSTTTKSTTNQRALGDLLQNRTVLNEIQAQLDRYMPVELRDPFSPKDDRLSVVVTILRQMITEAHQSHNPLLMNLPTDADFLYDLYAATVGWGVAQTYFDNPRVDEIKIIGRTIQVQEQGRDFVIAPEAFTSVTEPLRRVQLLASRLGIRLDESAPQQTLPVARGTRMHATIPPRVMEDDVLICLRRGRTHPWNLSDQRKRTTINSEVERLLRVLCAARCSVLIVGTTGSGKTALAEALANTWDGNPHIITIEDNNLELQMRKGLAWTRELVNTAKEPGSFGKVAVEALRQTPSLVLVGEVRSDEAGAILSLLTSGHPVITTIHASSCAEGLKRFARAAALPNSYMYAHRTAEALEDAAGSFNVVIKIENWSESGRRLVTEICVTDGLTSSNHQIVPAVRPVAKLKVTSSGEFDWDLFVHVDSVNNTLHWIDDPNQPMPAGLADKLLRAHTSQLAASQTTSHATIAAALQRAEALLLAQNPQQAIATLRDTWTHVADPRILKLVQQALRQLPQMAAEHTTRAQSTVLQITHAIQHRLWGEAHHCFQALHQDVVSFVATMPPGGWDQYEAAIRNGQAALAQAQEANQRANQAIALNTERQALRLLDTIDTDLLDVATLVQSQELRVQALRQLSRRGDSDAATLQSAEARLASLTEQATRLRSS